MSATQAEAGQAPRLGDERGSGLHYVITLHGIRTHGEWQERLGTLLKASSPRTQVFHFKFGVFSLISYVIPFLRWISVWRFSHYLEGLHNKCSGARIDIVAHSFGTHIAGHSLARVCRKVGLRVNTVILAGSVLKVWFPWNELIDKQFVRRVVNECGTKDYVLLWTQFVVLLTGMAGRIGFSGMLNDSFKNRYYKFGHGGCFEPSGDGGTVEERKNAFMQKRWVPLLTTDAPIDDYDARKASRLTPLEHLLLENADPIKLFVYVALFSGLVWYFGVVPYRNAAIAEQKAAIARSETNKIAASAFSSMHAFGDVVYSDANLQGRPELSSTRKKLLEVAGHLFAELEKQLVDESQMGTNARREFAKAHVEIARLTSEIGGLNPKNVDDVIRHFEEAVRILDQFDGQDRDDPETKWAKANALSGLGEGYLSKQKMDAAGDPSVAMKPLKRAREILRNLGSRQIRGERENYRRLMARTLIGLGVLDKKSAYTFYEEATGYIRDSKGSSSGSMPAIELKDEYGWLLINLGSLEAEAGHWEVAKSRLVEARAIFDKLVGAAGEPVPPPLKESLAWSLHDLGKYEIMMLTSGDRVGADPRRYQEALGYLRTARSMFDVLARSFDNPADRRADRYHIGLATADKDLGESIRSLYPPGDVERREEARRYLSEARTIYMEKLSAEKRDERDIRDTLSWVENALGWVLVDLYASQRGSPESGSLIEMAANVLERAYAWGGKNPEFGIGHAWGQIKLGDWQRANQATARAKESYETARRTFEAVRVGRQPVDPYHQKAAEGLKRCQDALSSLGRGSKPTTQVWTSLDKVTSPAPPDVKIELGRAAVIVRATGTAEPSVPVFRDGKPLRVDPTGQPSRFKMVEIYENASSKDHYPLILTDLVSIGFFRPTYQKSEGPGARMGTSVIGLPSFRPAMEPLKLAPQITRADITTGGVDRLRIGLEGRFDTRADVAVARTYPPPRANRFLMNLSVKFVAREQIALDRDLRGSDAFRLFSLSSMFATVFEYDANVLRYEDRGGVVQTLRLDDSTRRGAHLLPRGIELGTWFELIKSPGSQWFPDSPSIRIDIVDRSKVPGRLGLQGYLADTVDPNDDSLSVWIEWLDAPEILAPGTTVELDARVIATPPS